MFFPALCNSLLWLDILLRSDLKFVNFFGIPWISNLLSCIDYQEISIAANLPQKEIGKYIKILGEALQLSQPINSNSISVHMPRFCTLLQLNKSAQVLSLLCQLSVLLFWFFFVEEPVWLNDYQIPNDFMSIEISLLPNSRGC